MEASREVFWNIQFGEIVYILAVFTIIVFIYALYKRYKLWKTGIPKFKLDNIGKRLWNFTVSAFVDGIFHRRFFGSASKQGRKGIFKRLLPTDFYPGIIHYFIFIGCIILLIGSFLDFISHYFLDFMHGGFYLGYSLVTDIAGTMIIIGVILAIIRRYVEKPERLDNKREDLIALLLIMAVVVSGFLVESIRIAATELQTNPEWAPWSPTSFVLAQAFIDLNQKTLSNWHLITWWLHSLVSLGAIIYVSLYWNRLWHIIFSTLNAFFRNLDTKGILSREDFSVGRHFGVSRIDDFTWKELLDLDACTRCGRCQEVCPAFTSGKPLNPKKVIQDLREILINSTNSSSKDSQRTGAPSASNDNPSLSDVITEEVLWECTTCGACIEVCPVFIEPLTKLIGIRRYLVEMKARFPEELLNFFENIEQRSNPWGIAPSERTKWAADIDIQSFESGNTEYLFFVGCAGAFDSRNRRVTLALTQILDSAGISWGILGKDEPCCGDSLRRLGNEFVFDRMVMENIAMFREKGIKKIITQCPHCFHTLKNDYRQYDIQLDVIHHSELINNLVREGRLEIKHTGNLGNVVFHDSCYLGRYNNIYKNPRKAILKITNQLPIEMERCYDRSFCCGGGGGRMWMEESVGKHINVLRVEEALQKNADSICVCCPYCMTMFEDGLKDKGAHTKVRVMDLAEIVAKAIERGKIK
ncbi:MAG: (Fe-S)-binding protein [Dehalococcoidia bacterium]|nr:MAG: (Fe-S)-binding protein [Dehalococcoidia bacterium]